MTDSHSKAHAHLLKILKKFPQDYTPWGTVEREEQHHWVDCSHGCRWYLPVEGLLAMDWGVCTNPKSHRAGLLTFEHQGCLNGQVDREWEERLYDGEASQ